MTVTPKHASGPWHIEGQFDADVTVDIVTESGFTICELSPLDEEWTEEEIATARLIAAAPELLEQLMALVVQIKHSRRLLVPPNVETAINLALYGTESDPHHCYQCDRPKNDCACTKGGGR